MCMHSNIRLPWMACSVNSHEVVHLRDMQGAWMSEWEVICSAVWFGATKLPFSLLCSLRLSKHVFLFWHFLRIEKWQTWYRPQSAYSCHPLHKIFNVKRQKKKKNRDTAPKQGAPTTFVVPVSCITYCYRGPWNTHHGATRSGVSASTDNKAVCTLPSQLSRRSRRDLICGIPKTLGCTHDTWTVPSTWSIMPSIRWTCTEMSHH